MYLYLPTFSPEQPPIGEDGLTSAEPMRVYETLREAEAAALTPGGRRGRILVLEADLVTFEPADGPLALRAVPRAAVANLDRKGRFWRPRMVEAAGGLVLKDSDKGPRILCIHRRGVWDLPKGKLDPGETPAEAGVREVAEEVGIARDTLRITGDVLTTVHGYTWNRKNAFAVKITHWYPMATTATEFTPEAAERIDKVKWKRWKKAKKQLGFKTLRTMLASLNPEAMLAAAGSAERPSA